MRKHIDCPRLAILLPLTAANDGWAPPDWHDDSAQLIVSYVKDLSENRHDSVLRVDYGDIAPDACGVVVFDLDGLDAKDYESIDFWIKGGLGDEQSNIYLTSGDEPGIFRAYIDLDCFLIFSIKALTSSR